MHVQHIACTCTCSRLPDVHVHVFNKCFTHIACTQGHGHRLKPRLRLVNSRVERTTNLSSCTFAAWRLFAAHKTLRPGGLRSFKRCHDLRAGSARNAIHCRGCDRPLAVATGYRARAGTTAVRSARPIALGQHLPDLRTDPNHVHVRDTSVVFEREALLARVASRSVLTCAELNIVVAAALHACAFAVALHGAQRASRAHGFAAVPAALQAGVRLERKIGAVMQNTD